ncbi:MAG: hypothetical protein Q8S58_08040 [Bosea sp. (in: a-proteobacteria)]|uniref:hypothetical protein n=1 Tax=Bosea sp. (in: a-proteobacteria) TaxID=1871050 RepID=UPI0027330B40|nr:hypothetical protein [Bosea sp. (in: a-proteobacteria)]MDP3256297.1 hypothetical protein [Bosea sp. (in: a-proteobacteria)]MDP3319067.1 hypothetical protein [Bosea sp. (in: a-proteobacteria)]
MSDALIRRSSLLALPLLCLGLAGCGSSGSSSGQPSAMQTFGNVVMFQSTTPPPPDQLPTDADDERLICPEVIIADGGAAVRAQSGQDSGSLRHQISILNVARECTPTGNGGFRLKVGVEGRVLLGPAGGPGNYGATLTTLVTRGTTQLARRTARVGGTVGAGQGGTDFSHVEDGIVVPAGRGEVEIIVSLGTGPAAVARSRRR